MKKLSIASSAFVVLTMLSMGAQAATVVTGGRCTQKQMDNKLTSCETSEFTNSAGQTGYKCTCTDKLVRAPNGITPEIAPADEGVTSSNPTVSPAAPVGKTMPRN